MQWIESTGGPLIFAARSALKDWGGCNESPGAESDYQRACAINTEIGKISIASADAIVFGDEPDRMTMMELKANDLLFVRWKWAPSEEAMLRMIEGLIKSNMSSPSLQGTFIATQETYVLFDSSLVGGEAKVSLCAALEGGRYSYGSSLLRPDNSICALTHRITRS